MEMIHSEDIKVVLANVTCMVVAQFETLNAVLQAILIVATITYTIARTVNEIKKFKEKRNTNNQQNEAEG